MMGINVETQNPPKKWRFHSLFELLTTWIAFVGLGISIAGFIWVIKELKSNGEAVSTDIYLKTYGWTLEIDKLLIDSPTLRPYFINDNPMDIKPGSVDAGKVEAIADYMLDVYDAVLNNKTYFEMDKPTGEQWKKTISGYFRQSPVLCQRFLHNLALYGPALEDAYKNR